jgi:hypothetical protein
MVFRLVPLIGGPGPIAVTGPGPNGELYLADQNGVIMTYLSGTTTIFLDLRSQIPPLNPITMREAFSTSPCRPGGIVSLPSILL